MFLITEIFFSISSNLIHVLADDQLTRVLTKTAKKYIFIIWNKATTKYSKIKK